VTDSVRPNEGGNLAADGAARAAQVTQVKSGGETSPAGRSGLIAVIGMGIFCTTFGQTGVIGGFPLRFFFKDTLHLTASQVSLFFLISTSAWYFKPAAGLLSDCFPIFGTRRRHYLLSSALFCVMFWCAIGFFSARYPALLAATICLNAAMVIGSTVAGGMLVEAGQEMGATGRLSSMRIFLASSAQLMAAPLGAWMAGHWPFRISAMVIGLSFLPLALITTIWLRERETAVRDTTALTRTIDEFRLLFSSKLLWAAAGMWALVVLAPGFGTVLFYRQNDVLHFSKGFLSLLVIVSGLMGIVASSIYAYLCRRLSLRILLPLGIVLTASGALLYLNYNGHTALLIDGINGCLGSLALLALFDMAARATPRPAASLGYALLMSVNNIITQVADNIGSQLHDKAHWPFSHLVWLNAVTTLAALIAIPFLPRALMVKTDD